MDAPRVPGLTPPSPVLVGHRFKPLHEQLMTLLASLSADDWTRPTSAPAWQVRDVAAHLLDVTLRRLSYDRDKAPVPRPAAPVSDFRELVTHLNQLNATWVAAARRLSPRVILELLEIGGRATATHLATVDPSWPALFPVAWAGETASLAWMDLAREYTEHWHHQQQIRDAVGAPALAGRDWLHPVLDVSVRALPHGWRTLEAPADTGVAIEVTGPAGGCWTLVRDTPGWTLYVGRPLAAHASVELSDDTAWRLLYNALPRDQARSRVRVTGDAGLVEPLFATRSVMV